MKTIFIKLNSSQTIDLIKSLNTISVNTDENIKSDYIFFNEYTFNDNLDYCIRHNLSSNYTSLINKHTSNQIYNNYNFSTLPTIKPLQLSDVENFEGDKFFIKPVIGSGTNKYFNIPSTLLTQAYYTPINKQSILDIFSVENSSFWDAQLQEHAGFIIQKYSQLPNGSLDNPNHCILHGFCNGTGQIIFGRPTLGTKTIENNNAIITSTYTTENLTEEIIELQQKTVAMLNGENIINCIFSLQFIKYNNNFVPIDLNFRLPYQAIKLCSNNEDFNNYIKTCIEFTYDIVDNVSNAPNISSALYTPPGTPKTGILSNSIFATGTTKQEALSNLQNLTST